MVGRHGVAVTFGVLSLVGSALVWAPAGQADAGRHTETIGCVGTSDSDYEPPLTLVPRATRIHTRAQYTCTLGPGRTVAATGSLEGVSPAGSCVTITSSRTTETVRYADGTRSAIVYDTSRTIRVAGVLVVGLTGRVVEGRGAGRPAQRTVTALPSELPTACLAPGLTGSTGSAQLEIQP
jgi:hypothetical protein